MARNLSALASSLQSLLNPIITQIEVPDPLRIFYPNLTIDIAQCIDQVDKAVIQNRQWYQFTSKSTIKVVRIGQVTVYSNQIGTYDIYISRPTRKAQQNYPGIVAGARKEFKRGVRFFKIQESAKNSHSFEIREAKSYLSLIQASRSYSDDLSTLWQIPHNPQEISKAIVQFGYDPEITKILDRPSAHLTHMKKTLLVEDKGEPLNQIKIARKVADSEFAEEIVKAILNAGSKNFPALIPFDTKLENILCIPSGVKQYTFRCIDFSEPSITLVFIPNSILPLLGLPAIMHTLMKGTVLKSIYETVTKSNELEKYFIDSPGNNLTYLQAAFMIAAEEIISTFICLLCACTDSLIDFLSSYNRTERYTFENRPEILKLKHEIITFLEANPDNGINLPNLFIQKQELSEQIRRGLATEKKQIEEALAGRQNHLGRQWMHMLDTYFIKSAH